MKVFYLYCCNLNSLMRIYKQDIKQFRITSGNLAFSFKFCVAFIPLQYVTDIFEALRKESSTYGGMGHIYAVT